MHVLLLTVTILAMEVCACTMYMYIGGQTVFGLSLQGIMELEPGSENGLP